VHPLPKAIALAALALLGVTAGAPKRADAQALPNPYRLVDDWA
jgi:hypothetical protein